MTSHLSSLRTRWAAVGAAVAVTLGAVGMGGMNLVNADVSSGDRPVFIPINPCRLIDTRPGDPNDGAKSTPLGPDETITVTAHGENGECTGASSIPADALGLSLNVTAVGQTQRTFLTIWADGADPGTSNLNPEPGQPPTPNAVNTPLSTTGTFNIRNNAGNVNALVDVVGYYANHNHDDRYERIPDEVKLAPADFVTRNETADYARNAGLQLVTGSDCFQAPVHLPDGATIAAVTGIVSIQNANDSVDVRLSRSLLAEGTGSVNAQPGYIADIKQQVTATNTLVYISPPVDGDVVPDNGEDTVVDNDTFFYYAEVCISAGHTIWGYTVDLT